MFYFRLDKENRQQPLVPTEILNQMFSNIKSIFLFNHDFLLPQLEERMKKWLVYLMLCVFAFLALHMYICVWKLISLLCISIIFVSNRRLGRFLKWGDNLGYSQNNDRKAAEILKLVWNDANLEHSRAY